MTPAHVRALFSVFPMMELISGIFIVLESRNATIQYTAFLRYVKGRARIFSGKRLYIRCISRVFRAGAVRRFPGKSVHGCNASPADPAEAEALRMGLRKKGIPPFSSGGEG
jgi:hypothetical protein